MNYKQALSDLNLVYPDGISKGFPLWTEEGLKIQNKTTEELLQLFREDFDIQVNYTSKVKPFNEYKKRYKHRIQKYDNTIPIFEIDGDWQVLITDALPYNLERLDKENLKFLLTYYSVIRLLDVKQIPMSRDYYISPLLQMNLVIEEKTEEEAIQYVLNKINQFFHKINIPIVILEYEGIEGYSSKVYMVGALNYKNEIQTILQCSLLSKQLLQDFEVSKEMQDKMIFDIGYSQKLFAYLADNNLDKYGMRLPSVYRRKEIVVIYREDIKGKLLDKLLQEELKEHLIYCSELGKKKLKRIKNEFIKKGVRTIFVHQIDKGEEWFDIYSIEKEKRKVETIEEIKQIVLENATELDKYYYQPKDQRLESIRQKGYGYVSEFKQRGKVVRI